ncbi:MAG TPA: HEAT repeat domain-containing protein [Methanoculleus sp.]|nr:HEAT repeat domain-containing protein [Methanoculleus sp.]
MEQLPGAEGRRERNDIADLMATLQNGNSYTRLQAARALGEIGAPAVGPLVQALTDRGTCFRWTIAIALARVGLPAVESLIDVVTTRDDPVRNPAVWALAEIGDTRAVEPLLEVMVNGATDCSRGLAAAALLKLGHSAGVAAVEKELLSANETFKGVVFEAVEGL